ncbi:MAG: HD domain-containing phosphohydrolase [Chloroherpetonaceae bacterium]|nr:HD domain-containing protein [Chthonomonadaceae bacterium]MDW8207183.1 HD domain-containing phosphohydrolase [Chloroherpetonaceae bacterium]
MGPASRSNPAEIGSPGPVADCSTVRVLLAMQPSPRQQAFRSVLLAAGYEVWCTATARETCALLARDHCDILLCDVQQSDGDGFQLMAQALQLHPDLPVILIAEQASVDLARQAIYAGASDFLSATTDPHNLPIILERNITRHNVQHTCVRPQKATSPITLEAVLDTLLTAINARDIEAPGHSECVTAYTMALADRLALPTDQRTHIERGALLHDIGKIAIPDHILYKPGPLTAEEWDEMRRHALTGYQMCAPIPALQQAALIVRHHHERWDGTGYPDGLRGAQIPPGARLFAIADALDAITAGRPYRPAQPFAVAREEIRRCRGTQFDPELVDLFLSIPEETWETIHRRAYRS